MGNNGCDIYISPSGEDKYCIVSLYVEPKKKKVIETEIRLVVTRILGVGEGGEVGKRIQIFSYKMIKLLRSKV